MVKDSFSGKEIPRGTGMMYVKKDGTIFYFADKKSEKNLLKLERKPGKTRWTETYAREKEKRKELLGKKAKVSPVIEAKGIAGEKKSGGKKND